MLKHIARPEATLVVIKMIKEDTLTALEVFLRLETERKQKRT